MPGMISSIIDLLMFCSGLHLSTSCAADLNFAETIKERKQNTPVLIFYEKLNFQYSLLIQIKDAVTWFADWVPTFWPY